MQILVVVASIQVRILKTDVWRRVPCEQQLYMGQSVLSDRLTPCETGVMRAFASKYTQPIERESG